MALDLCRAVATGGRLWDFAATTGDVLYFALEDRHRRIQDRLKKIQAENVNLSRLHTSLTAAGLHNGLLEDIDDFISFYPQTNLVVIDTFEHIRNGGSTENTLYACDYKDMNKLREITNKHKLTPSSPQGVSQTTVMPPHTPLMYRRASNRGYQKQPSRCHAPGNLFSESTNSETGPGLADRAITTVVTGFRRTPFRLNRRPYG